MDAVIAVVIVTFSAQSAMLDACLAAVRASGDADCIIVVDNGGRAMVGSDVELVRPKHNLGFGGGAIAGFRRAAELGATEIALINDDVEVGAGWLRLMVVALESDPKIGAVQPKLLLAGTDPPRINSVGVAVGRDGAGIDIAIGEPDSAQFAGETSIDAFTGGAVLFRAEFLDATGGFDESYFLYYEDLDLARRGAELGWTYRCLGSSVVWHQVSASTSQLGNRSRYLQERNRLRFAFRHGDRQMMVGALWLSIRRLRWKPRWAHARALVVGLALAPRARRARRLARR